MKSFKKYRSCLLILVLAVLTAGLLLSGCRKQNNDQAAVIGGADGPTSIYVAPQPAGQSAAQGTGQTAQEAVPDLVLLDDQTNAGSALEAQPAEAAELKEARTEEAKTEETKTEETKTEEAAEAETAEAGIDEDGIYTSKDDVALYIHTYGKLPQNFITKKEAQALGWTGGSLEPYAPGKCIGGDYFGNYEGKLPKNTKYNECDIGTLGKKSRGAKRIIYSKDGKIYYTGDHYETFEQLY